MKRKTLTATAAAAAIALVATALVAGPSLAHGPQGVPYGGQYFGGPAQQGQAGYGMMGHMGPGMGSGMGRGMGPGMGPGMGHGMMGSGWGPGAAGQGMGPGAGYGMGPGMMGYGAGPGMMGYGPGAYGANSYGDCPAIQAAQGQDLTVEGVTAFLERRLAWQGNERLKVGAVSEQDDDTIVAEIVTQDGSLVDRLTFDRHSGRATRAE